MLLTALLRGHRRARTLEIALNELVRYGELPGLEVAIHLTLDRPTPDVLKVALRFSERLFKLRQLDFPLVSPQGERFCEALNLQLADLEEADLKPDWLYLADDDRWLEPLSITVELPRALKNPDIDLWYARSIFFWDHPGAYNPARYHHAPLFSRYRPGDRFPLDRMIQAPAEIHDHAIVTGRIKTLRTPLLDYGSFTQDERDTLYRDFEAAGKIDDYTTSLIRPPLNGISLFPRDAFDAGLMPSLLWKDLYSAGQD